MRRPERLLKRIAIIGGGIAGVTAAWQLARLAESHPEIGATLFEASRRLGGIVETVNSAGFTIECGPDAWVTEKPWAHQLAIELGLADQVMPSNDATRKTYIMQHGQLVAMPDGMRMMVPGDLDALDASPLFSEAAKSAFRMEIARASELKASAPDHDESVAAFVERHFGIEVLDKIGAPLLSGVFGGDVTKLSVRAVMAPFVAMEREHGSLILALQRVSKPPGQRPAVFTTLQQGTGALIDRMVTQIPPSWIRLQSPITAIARTASGWSIETANGPKNYDGLLLAAPIDVASCLLQPIDQRASELMRLEASSAVVVGFGFTEHINLPPGFGFLVPPGSSSTSLLAGTFVDQKFAHRCAPGSRLLRAFFGGATADSLLGVSDEDIAARARTELENILGRLPSPVLTVVRRWPRALPQYAVGHLERMEELFKRVADLGGLYLLGNGYRGVGLPDLVRDARAAAHAVVGGL